MAETWSYETPEMRTHRLVQPHELDNPEPVAPLAPEQIAEAAEREEAEMKIPQTTD